MYVKHTLFKIIAYLYKKATFISCDGKFAEDEVIIDRIGAYEYAFILLEK